MTRPGNEELAPPAVLAKLRGGELPVLPVEDWKNRPVTAPQHPPAAPHAFRFLKRRKRTMSCLRAVIEVEPTDCDTTLYLNYRVLSMDAPSAWYISAADFRQEPDGYRRLEYCSEKLFVLLQTVFSCAVMGMSVAEERYGSRISLFWCECEEGSDSGPDVTDILNQLQELSGLRKKKALRSRHMWRVPYGDGWLTHPWGLLRAVCLEMWLADRPQTIPARAA
ncbi:hypothetical protein AB0H92_10930 [Streptomyces phaeochromogenes]|uniref:hypothetical protein n=1 Tax=Streptomyces phaeochromogenes TaxID=1923 RepID=UPI0033F8672E